MVNRNFVLVAAGGFPLVLLASGCSMCKARTTEVATTFTTEPRVTQVADLLPTDAKPGECFVRVYVPAQFETFEETVKVRDASTRLEVVPARYEWVEEQVMVKDASTVLEEIPAEFEMQERRVLVEPGHTGWQIEKTDKCLEPVPRTAASEMFCLVSHEPVYETVRTNVMVKPATTRCVEIPAQYQTVRREKLVAPATTRSIPIPEEYATVQQTRKVADARIEWQRVQCEPTRQAETEFESDITLVRDPVP